MKKILHSKFHILNFWRRQANLPRKQKKPRWQREQAAKKTKKQKSAFKFWFLVSAFLFLAGFCLKAIKIYRESVWQGEGRVSIVFSCQPLVLFSYSSFEQSSLVSLLIPGDTQIEVIHGYGKYKVSSIPKLEELEKRELLTESVEQALGVPIEGFIKLTDCQASYEEEVKKLFLKSISSAFLQKAETNLGKWDLARLFLAARGVKGSQSRKLDLKTVGVLDEVTLPDGSQVWEVSVEKFDLKLGEYFQDEKARQEGLAIEVLNGTDHPGLAEGAARILENLGLELVGVSNAPEKKDECYLFGSSRVKKTYTARRLMKIFDCQYQEGQPEKADLSLVLGEAYWRKLGQR